MKRFLFLTLGIVFTLMACITVNNGPDIPVCSSEEAITVARPAARMILTPAFIAQLRARATAGDSYWTSLKTRCDGYSAGTMVIPNGDAEEEEDYPDVGSGYQGETYLPAIMQLGLCYQVSTSSADKASYADSGNRLLQAMATPAASGGVNIPFDHGYGIRNYVVGMAFGFDWLYPGLTSATKTQVVTAINAWIDYYDASGYLNNDGLGNYFAGYFLAKTAAALATEDDNVKAAAYLTDVQDRMYGALLKPRYLSSMGGGGFPEGWQYGPRAVQNVVLAQWAVKTAKNVDWWSEVPHARDEARYIQYGSWPARNHMNDYGTIRDGVPGVPAATAATLAQFLAQMGESSAPKARAFSAELGVGGDYWEKFLFFDSTLPSASYKDNLSYFAPGPNMVYARSDWSNSATWGGFPSGTYIGSSDSGEELFNQGSFAVVSGGTPILINATGQMASNYSGGETDVYNDGYGGGRKLYNTFYGGSIKQGTRGPSEASTHIEKYEEGGPYVRAQGTQLEQMYSSGLTKWTRNMVYIRPNTFVLSDFTQVPSNVDQWMSFHFIGSPAGHLVTILPLGTANTDVTVGGTIMRREVHSTGLSNQWINVITANASAAERVASSDVMGTAVKDSINAVAVFPLGSSIASAHYSYTQTAPSVHVLSDVVSATYNVTVSVSGGVYSVTAVAGGSLARSAGGNLCFQVAAGGAVSACPGVVIPPPVDAGVDSGPPPVDSGTDSGPVDSGPVDSGPVDSGPPPVDSGPVDSGPVDSGPPPVDSGPPPVDSGTDSGPHSDAGNDAGACYKLIR